jgi:hypothetical protein
MAQSTAHRYRVAGARAVVNEHHPKPDKGNIMRLRLTVLSIAAGMALLGACATKDEAAAPNVLVAAKVATAPTLDGNANDPAWASAKPITVALDEGANFGGTGRTTATLKAV